jgi:hypothetical protein
MTPEQIDALAQAIARAVATVLTPSAAPPRAPITDLHQLPTILTLQEIAAVYRVSKATIRRGLQDSTFRPLPYEKYPYRWLRVDVERDLKTRRPKLKMRRHGFATTKAQTTKRGKP